MALKANKYAATEKIAAGNAAFVQDKANLKQNQYDASVLLRLFAELLDAIAAGDLTHVTLGMPTSRSAFLLTLNFPDKSQRRSGGVDLHSLIEQAATDNLDTGGQG